MRSWGRASALSRAASAFGTVSRYEDNRPARKSNAPKRRLGEIISKKEAKPYAILTQVRGNGGSPAPVCTVCVVFVPHRIPMPPISVLCLPHVWRVATFSGCGFLSLERYYFCGGGWLRASGGRVAVLFLPASAVSARHSIVQ